MSSNSATTSLTSEQANALTAHERSVSIAAGAGCGKTFVLTERFLSYLDPRLLEPTADLHELVAITFTDAAAREMRDRIRHRCYEHLDQAASQDEQQAWQQLLRAMDAARISTIHAFCATLLRNHAAEAEVDPRFELLDPPAAELLRLQTLDDRLRQLLLAGDERLMQLATRFGLRYLRDNVARLLSENARPVIDKWIGATPEQLLTAWQEYSREIVIPDATEALLTDNAILQLRRLIETADQQSDKLRAHLHRIHAVLESLAETNNTGPLTDELRQLARVQGVCTKKDWTDPEDYELYKQACTSVRKLLEKSILHHPSSGQAPLITAELGLHLLDLIADVLRAYDGVKQQRNVLEFDDLLTRTHSLLTDPRHPSIRQNLARDVKLLMVDEFQDTDPLQVAIVQAFCGDDWSEQGLFVVGDFKQSIYRFRGAEPRVSSELRATLPPKSRLSLTTNFRSQPAVLDFVNALFCSTFADDYEPLRPSRPQATPTPAVEFLWAVGGDRSSQNKASRRHGQKQQARALEARYIARRLAQLLDSGEPSVVDKANGTKEPPSARPLRLGDIAILLRSLGDVALYEEALREHGLDYYLAGGHAFYAQQEIYDILHLLRAIASPADELSLAGALRSPLFALEDETLFWLVQTHGSLNAGLLSESAMPQLTADEQAKVVRAAATIHHLRSRKDRLLVAELLGEALERTGYDAALLCEFLGHRKLANVHKLLQQAQAIDRTRPGDLNGFITQLSEFVVRAPKEPLATTQAEGDVIRIMTIHHAKGLEFPLVVVPDLGRAHRSSPKQPVLDQQLGPLVPPDDQEQKTCVGWDLHRYVEKQQDLQERKRLLYVACTRAADYLILSSSVADLEKPESDWLELLSERFDLQTGRCRVELPGEYNTPQVLVTTAEPEIEHRAIGQSRGTDLTKLVAKTRQLAAQARGIVPDTVAPIPLDMQARKHFSFSRLTGHLAQAETTTRTNSESASLDPLGLGTLIHDVLERIDFSTNNDVQELCQYLAPLHLENDWNAAAIAATEMVKTFVHSHRAAQLAKAAVIRREVEFVLPWPPEKDRSNGRYLQGFIDCLYQDAAGDWHLLDYKSNQTTAERVSETAQHYAMQMFVYSLACERALGKKPVECVLHFLRPAAEFTFTWDQAQRSAMATQLNTAIETQLG